MCFAAVLCILIYISGAIMMWAFMRVTDSDRNLAEIILWPACVYYAAIAGGYLCLKRKIKERKIAREKQKD